MFALLMHSAAYGQNDTVTPAPPPEEPEYRVIYRPVDPELLARRRAYRDSMKRVGDSLARVWIKAPDPNRPNQFIDSLIDLYKVENLDFAAWAKKFKKKTSSYKEGELRPRGEPWVIWMILFLVFLFALIRFFFPKQIESIFQSFFSNQVLGQLQKEDTLFSSWPFIYLYILFGLVLGMYLYLAGRYFQFSYSEDGFNNFLLLSILVTGLFSFKILVLKLLAFLFDIRRIVGPYISILYMSFFNTAILFLPLVFAFSLSPHRYAEIFSYAGLIIFGFIFLLQFIRAGTNILSTYRFPKVYLIIYLCALEFCPILILIKTLR